MEEDGILLKASFIHCLLPLERREICSRHLAFLLLIANDNSSLIKQNQIKIENE